MIKLGLANYVLVWCREKTILSQNIKLGGSFLFKMAQLSSVPSADDGHAIWLKALEETQ